MRHIYADDVADLQMNSTSLRFTLVQRNPEGGFSEVGRVILPAISAREVFDALDKGLTEITEQVRARHAKAE
ncbi:MAG: hypothetical protein JNL61_18200 [Rhizobiaceae bacterium]|nr:hypothetical protein [Rhizobiaceae bacterium]